MARRDGPTGVIEHGMPERVPQEPERSRRLRGEGLRNCRAERKRAKQGRREVGAPQ